MEAAMETAAPEKIALTVKEAAELMGVGRNIVYTLTRRADFPKVHVGRKILINRRLLEEWLTDHEGEDLMAPGMEAAG